MTLIKRGGGQWVTLICAAVLVACTSTTPEEKKEAGTDAEADVGADADAGQPGPGACATKACGEDCDKCEWGACTDDAAPHQLQCNRFGKCVYISMSNIPPPCQGPTECGDASCGDGSYCHCMFNAAKRCCPVGTECEPCL